MFAKNHPIILFLDRSGFSVFQDTLPNIAKFNFTPDIVANLDVVSREQFVSLIATFIQINKIVPSTLVLILSDNIIYQKDLPVLPLSLEAQENIGKERKEGIQEFLEDVPFEEVLAKVIKTDKFSRIAAVNKELAMTIADAFANKGSAIEAIIPGFMYGSNVNFAAGLTQDNIQAVLKESEILRTGNLLTDQQKINSFSDSEAKRKDSPAGGEKKPQNLRQYILVSVFITLLIILAVVYLNLGVSQTPPVSSRIVPTAPPAGEPTIVQAQASLIPVDFKSIKVKITQSSQADEKTANLRNVLLNIGFVDVVNEVSEVSTAEKSSIIFSQSIPADLKYKMITEIKKIFTDVAILENQDSDLTITILIGKSVIE